MRTALIVAMTREGLMGRDLSLPWHWPEDLKHFQRTTKGRAVVMGRRTFDSLRTQFGGPLKGRLNLVVSRERGGAAPDGVEQDGARWFASLPDAVAYAARHSPPPPPLPAPAAGASGAADSRVPTVPGEVFILGGSEIFRAAFEELRPPPGRLVVTWVPDVPVEPGDTFFPFRPALSWVEERFRPAMRWSGADGALDFVVYERR